MIVGGVAAVGWALLAAWGAHELIGRWLGPRRSPPAGVAPHRPVVHRHGPVRRRPRLGLRRRPRRTGLLGTRRILVIAAAIAGTGLVGPFPVLFVAATAVTVHRARAVAAARRHRRRIDEQIPDAVELLVLAVRAGMTVHQAVRLLSGHAPPAVRPGFVAVVHRLDRGAPLADALRALPDTLGPPAAAVDDALGPAERYGLPLAPALEQLARDARRVRRMVADADARRLPVRLTFPLVTCTLPAFVALAIAPALIAALSSLGAAAW